jgi:hypothetical protein
MSNFEMQLKQVIFDGMSEFFKELQTLEEGADVNDVTLRLKDFIFGDAEITPNVKPKATRTKKEKKDLLSEERCIAKNKDHTRCKGKRQAKGTVPEYCVLHNKNGANFGIFDENQKPDDIEESEIENEIENKPKTKGKSKKTKSEEIITEDNDFE